MRCLLLYTFSLVLVRFKCRGDLSVAFRKTRVIEDIRPFQSSYNISVRSRLGCSKVCASDANCRKYLYCEHVGGDGNGWCSVYPDGEDCVYVSSNLFTCSCYQKWKHSNGTHCLSPIGYYGPSCEHIIVDCAEGFGLGMQPVALSYVQPTYSSQPFEIFCDKGHSVVQVRTDYFQRQDFNRSWNDYETGFGHLHSEHWLGFKKIRNLNLNAFTYSLIITLYNDLNPLPLCVITLTDLNIDSSSMLWFGTASFQPFCPPNINQLIGPNFSTFDFGPNQQCAKLVGGGWWFSLSVPYCSSVNVNARPDLMTLQTQNSIIKLNKVVISLGRSP